MKSDSEINIAGRAGNVNAKVTIIYERFNSD